MKKEQNSPVNLDPPALKKINLAKISDFFHDTYNYAHDHLKQIVLVVAPSAIIFGLVFKHQLDESLNPSFAVAKAGGATIKFYLTALIIVPVLRVALTILQNTNLNKYIGLDEPFALHKLAASGLMIASIIHTVGQLVTTPSNIKNQYGITGLIMLSALVIPLGGMAALSKLKALKKQGYDRSFLRPHQLGAIIFFAAYLPHTVDYRLVPWTAAITGSFILDRFIEHLFYTHRGSLINTRTSYLVGQGRERILELVVTKPPKFKRHEPGQYAYLHFPQIEGRLRSSHPFTIASATNENSLKFIITAAGARTQELLHLFEITKNNEPGKMKDFRVTLSGPFGSPLQSASKKSNLILVSSGSGMSPFLSLITQRGSEEIPIEIKVIHSGKTIDSLMPFIETIYMASLNQVKINEVHFFATSLSSKKPKLSLVVEQALNQSFALSAIDYNKALATKGINLEDEIAIPIGEKKENDMNSAKLPSFILSAHKPPLVTPSFKGSIELKTIPVETEKPQIQEKRSGIIRPTSNIKLKENNSLASKREKANKVSLNENDESLSASATSRSLVPFFNKSKEIKQQKIEVPRQASTINLESNLELDKSFIIPRRSLSNNNLANTKKEAGKYYRFLGTQQILIEEKEETINVSSVNDNINPHSISVFLHRRRFDPSNEKIFQEMLAQKESCLFFCGNPIIGKKVETACKKAKIYFKKESFNF